MAVDFPNSPTNGDKFTSGTLTWTYSSDKNGWNVTSSGINIGPSGPTGPTGPTGVTGPTGPESTAFTINAQTDSYTLVLTDAGKLIEMNKATANNLTVPLNATVAFPVGTTIGILQTGAGQTTVVATGGVTINSYGSRLKLTGQWSSATLIKRATDTWVLIGDITS